VAVQALLDSMNINPGLELEIQKGVPIVGGMGSSASSAVAAVVAVNELLGLSKSTIELLPFVLESEKAATGVPHADNAAPAILGNFVLIRSYTPLDLIVIPPPEKLFCSLVHPHTELRTSFARSVLPTDITLKDATRQWGNVGALVAGLLTSDYALVGRSLVDVVAEPKRAPLIPGFADVKEAALKAGALGCSIAGSGPSIFAFSDSAETALSAGEAMQKAFLASKNPLKSDMWVSPICREGARIL